MLQMIVKADWTLVANVRAVFGAIEPVVAGFSPPPPENDGSVATRTALISKDRGHRAHRCTPLPMHVRTALDRSTIDGEMALGDGIEGKEACGSRARGRRHAFVEFVVVRERCQ